MNRRLPLDFSAAMFDVCVDVTRRVPEFRHVRMAEVAVTFAQARRKVAHGLQAKLTPMRFESGTLETSLHGKRWTVQRIVVDGREMLYLLTFYLPRFLNHAFREKLITVFHELYHISPRFDGDIRRFDGHYHVHSHSQKQYDAHMETLVDKYLQTSPPAEQLQFLHDDFLTLQRRYGQVVGLQIPIPKLLPVSQSA